jgi:hypothetical protein
MFSLKKEEEEEEKEEKTTETLKVKCRMGCGIKVMREDVGEGLE